MTTRRLHLWFPPLAYAVLIFLLSAQSNPLPALTTQVWDKLLHMVEYAGLALLVGRAWIGEGTPTWKAVLMAIVLSSLYAATDEWHQAYVPFRSSDVRDWMADTVGSMLGAGLALVLAGWLAGARKSR